jgi:adenylate cyclase, class 2
VPVEIEAKIKVADFAPVRQRLEQCSAKFRCSVLETNTFFDRDDRSLFAKDQGLRLRHTRDRKTNAEAAIITFKGPRQPGRLKRREELELTVDNAVSAIALLESLGFSRVVTFQKRRESWDLGKCHVELDEMPHVGTFVEIEGPDETAVLKVRDQLLLSENPLVRASYLGLLMTYLAEHKITKRSIVFP